MPLRYFACAFGAGLVALAPMTGAHGSRLKTVYSFCSLSNCTDGYSPLAGVLQDASGNLYGTTEVGGAHNDGVVFEIVPNHRAWTYKVLHSFCYGCGDGTNPVARLILDVNGNLYGTTAQSGPTGCGTAFMLAPGHGGSKWKETTIYAASCAPFGNNILTGLAYKGAASGAPYDGVSPLYGTTVSGGTGYGTVYSIVPKDGGWKETDLYAFCPGGTSGCNDGRSPGDLIVDDGGNLYGNTNSGGSNGGGTIYELEPAAGKKPWTEHILYDFCAAANCADGGNPTGAPVMDSSGNLFGTAADAMGVVFELKKKGKAWDESVLYTFCSQQNCDDGEVPAAGVILDGAGNLYGTTMLGGGGGSGEVFRLHGNTLRTLYSFCSSGNCAGGSAPLAPLIIGASGKLYGTASQGGNGSDGGTVFELKP